MRPCAAMDAAGQSVGQRIRKNDPAWHDWDLSYSVSMICANGSTVALDCLLPQNLTIEEDLTAPGIRFSACLWAPPDHCVEPKRRSKLVLQLAMSRLPD